MSEVEKNDIGKDPVVEAEPESLKSQVGALLVLLVVAGAVWILFHYLPKLGDWLGETADQVVGPGETEVVDGKDAGNPLPEPSGQEEPMPSRTTPEKSVEGNGQGRIEHYKAQLAEQLGRESNTIVRHLAISDDENRLVAALARDEGEGPELVEIFFERDEFGRYRSVEDAPLETPITLWSE